MLINVFLVPSFFPNKDLYILFIFALHFFSTQNFYYEHFLMTNILQINNCNSFLIFNCKDVL